MRVFNCLVWFTFIIVIWTVNETSAHPKSWLTTPRSRPKRLAAEEDVSFSPGLKIEFEDTLRIEKLGKFSQEETEEEVIIRLLQEEEERELIPKEPNKEKHGKMPLKTPFTRFQESMEAFEFPSENIGLESLSDDTPWGNPNRNPLESTTYTTANLDPFGPEISNIPQELFARLQSIEQKTSNEEAFDQRPFKRQNIPLHHDVDMNHRQRQEPQDFDHDKRRTVLLRRLLNHQQQITEDNMKFLSGENTEEKEDTSNNIRKDYDNVNFLNGENLEEKGEISNYIPKELKITKFFNGEDIEEKEENTNKIHEEYEPEGEVLSEAQLNWEEYHEDDA